MDRIRIQGYKSLADVTLDIMPINILIGGNGAGKSNFLSFFGLMRAVYMSNAQSYVNNRGGISRVMHHGNSSAREVRGFINLGNKLQEGYQFDLVPVPDGFIIGVEYVFKDKVRSIISAGNRESSLKGLSGRHTKKIFEALENIHAHHFHDTGENTPFSDFSHLENDSYYLYFNGRNIAAYLYHIRETNRKAYNRIIKNIQSIAPYFLDFFLQPNDGKFIRLQWRDKYSEYIYGVNDLSDGTMRFIALTVLFLQPKLPGVLIIDEPELGLHPVAIAKLAGMIKLAAAKGCKVIVATQSPALVDQFEAEDIVTVDNVEGASRFRRLKKKDLKLWLEDYSLGELWERSVIQNAQP